MFDWLFSDLEMLLYIPSSNEEIDLKDAWNYNPKAETKGAGAVIMVQNSNTAPSVEGGQLQHLVIY